MNQHEKIKYVEFPAHDFDATKAFFTVFLIGHSPIMDQNISPLQALG
jgi:hypothetical protein